MNLAPRKGFSLKFQRNTSFFRSSRLKRIGALSSMTAVFLALVTPGIAHAETLDQRQEDSQGVVYSITQTSPAAQTFTSAITGTLNRVDLYLSRLSSAHDMTMEIRSVTADGAPADVLSTYTVPIGSVPAFPGGWVPVALNQAVTAGTQYAIVLHGGDSNPAQWHGAKNNPYLGGGSWRYSTPPAWSGDFAQDLGFKTYATGTGAQTDPSVYFYANTSGAVFPTVTFTAAIYNAGPEVATKSVLYIQLPDTSSVSQVKLNNPESCTYNGATYILCNVGDVAAEGRATLSFQAKITSPGQHTVTAAVYSPTLDANPVNNRSSDTCVADITTAFVSC
ncbi:DUF11 domain-containing protein [Amycolatopsis sp. SID8362]|uniref:DUF11 domain-containing protein n=1 Tax=Amycolatopsis sp. SID8362 TaxID=2690346 RepID=UPI00136F8070|nr:DUF11 domain-containing protein [Amycolatopsis sp. SID8362]NBH10363.1 hypothetical protein [Amycolatopsis sp. SID8362]NED47058.1 hypothetical protein [Amycolatopsis sp. SID8362]